MTVYGFLGLGMMGAPMAQNLADAAGARGDRLLVWNRTPGRDRAAVARGAERVEEPADLLAAADVAVVMLPDLVQLRDLVDGPAGILSKVSSRTVLVVGSTVSAAAAREFAEHVSGSTHGRVSVIDAPVSGGPEGAAAGTLSIMVGGADEDVALARPALDAMGTTVRHVGAVGAGSLAKACNQMVVSATMVAIAEAATLAEAAGVDVRALLDVLGGGLANSRVLELKGDNMVSHTYGTAGLARYMSKDLEFVRQAVEATGVRLDQAALSRSIFDAVDAAGLGDQDMSVVQALVRQRSGLG